MTGWNPPNPNLNSRHPLKPHNDLPLNSNNNARFPGFPPSIPQFPDSTVNSEQEARLSHYSEPPNIFNPSDHPQRIPAKSSDPQPHNYYNVQPNLPQSYNPPIPPRQQAQAQPPPSFRETASPTPPPLAERCKLKDNMSVGCVCFKYEALKLATKNFNQTKHVAGGCLLGEGGFGPVYLGHICATTVAIKVLQTTGDRKVYKGDEQFKTEISSLTKYRHHNLLTLMGYSDDGPERCIVYEYMSNGTLEDWLEGKMSQSLTWQYRQSILMDTARGLLYLHAADPEHPLIHRDVKTANVLLDAFMQAKVGDFGLARQTDINDQKKTGTILGTSGYIPPEYYRGEISVKTDIFAFGVVILEVLTGLPSFDGQNDPKELVSRLRRVIEKDYKRMIRWIDKLSGKWPTGAYVDISELAWNCLEKFPEERPLMFKVLQRLHEISEASHVEAARMPLYNH